MQTIVQKAKKPLNWLRALALFLACAAILTSVANHLGTRPALLARAPTPTPPTVRQLPLVTKSTLTGRRLYDPLVHPNPQAINPQSLIASAK